MAPRLADDRDGPDQDRPMTLGEHLDELRKRVVWALLIAAVFCIACAIVEEELVGIALWPAWSVMRDVKGAEFISTEISEQFLTGMKVDIVVGLFLSAPLILYILWGFVARGLHPHEKRYVRIYAPVSYVLFLGGCLFFYFVIQPITLRFLLTYHATDVLTPDLQTRIAVTPKLTMQNTVSFFLSMTLITGLFFEMPLVMLFLQAIRICTWRTYVRYARHFVFGLAVLSAVITPTGDMATLAIFMCPVLVLFAGGILACRIMAPRDV
jgi:sec-independent protein translocase protein TatC